jgi:Cu/Ag efflux protein CusF
MNRTKKILCAMGFGVASWVAMAPAVADDPKPDDQATPAKAGAAANKTKSMSAMQRKTTEATVVSVDKEKRHLTVKNDAGLEMTLQVPEGVKRLDEVKPGDKLKVDYFESVGLSLKRGEGAQPGESTLTERKAGKLPSGVVAHQESGPVEIVKIDKDQNQVTVKRPNGDTDVIDVKDPDMQAQLGNLKEGDKIQATYTEAALISITREKGDMKGEKGAMKEENMKPEDQQKPEDKSM